MLRAIHYSRDEHKWTFEYDGGAQEVTHDLARAQSLTPDDWPRSKYGTYITMPDRFAGDWMLA